MTQDALDMRFVSDLDTCIPVDLLNGKGVGVVTQVTDPVPTPELLPINSIQQFIVTQ